MLRRSSSCLLAASVLVAQSFAQEAVERVAARPPAPAQTAAPAQARAVPGHGFVLEAGDVVIEDLVDAAAQFLNRNILFAAMELQAAGGKSGVPAVRLQNRLELDALGCEEMLSSLLSARGFALTPLDAGRNVYEVLAINGPRSREIFNRAVAMPPDEVLRRPMLRMVVLTTLDLQHIQAPVAVNALRPFFSQPNGQGVSLQLGNAGGHRSIVLQGFADQVAAGIRMIRDCDKPPTPEQQTELEQRMQQLEQQMKAQQQQIQALQQQGKRADKAEK